VAEQHEVDALARELALTKYGLPLCLHIPVAARNADAVARFVGRIDRLLMGPNEAPALLVQAYELSPVDPDLSIWQQPGADVLRQRYQVWVHVDDRRYRAAYAKAFPSENIANVVIDHVMNRRVARLKSFGYVRVVAISRAANSSSGGLSEKWAVAYHGTSRMVVKNHDRSPFIQYADLGDIVKMLNLKTGGSLQEAVNDAQAWVTDAT